MAKIADTITGFGCDMNVEWIDGFNVRVKAGHGTVTVSANREGLLSLARHLTALADEKVGCHMHYDEHNSLEDGSNELIIEKTGES